MWLAPASGSSLLLGEEGWTRFDCLHGHVSVAGIDRLGKVAFAEVLIEASSSTERELFLGTSKCCGSFCETTLIQDSTGKVFCTAAIVRDGNIGDLFFEFALSSGDFAVTSRIVNGPSLWHSLSNEAAFETTERIIIRCRNPDFPQERNIQFGRLLRFGRRFYYTLSRQAFEVAIGQIGLFLDELYLVFRSTDDTVEVFRPNSELAMAVASRLASNGITYELTYDSLQHTAAICIRTPSTSRGYLGNGRCAHAIAASACRVWRIRWSKQQWNPLVNGLVVMGTQTK